MHFRDEGTGTYSFNFESSEASELTLILAVTESRFIEFLAKPEQVSKDVIP